MDVLGTNLIVMCLVDEKILPVTTGKNQLIDMPNRLLVLGYEVDQ